MRDERHVLQAFHHLGHLLLGKRHLFIYSTDYLRRQTTEVLFARGDDESTHVDGSRTDEILGIANSRIAIGTVLATRQHHTEQLVALLPHDDIHHGFLTVGSDVLQGVIQTAEKPFAICHATAAHKESGSGIVRDMPDARHLIVAFQYFDQIAAEALPGRLQRHHAITDKLQMSVVRCRGTTQRTII